MPSTRVSGLAGQLYHEKDRQSSCNLRNVLFFEILVYLAVAAALSVFAWRHGEALDKAVIAGITRCRQVWRKKSQGERDLMAEIAWAQLLQGSLRSGLSVEQAIAETRKLPLFNDTFLQRELARLQAGGAPASNVGLVLQLGRSMGGSMGESLNATKRGLQARLRATRKLRASTSQARLQIAIASILPLLLVFASALVAPDLFFEALLSPLAWGIFASATLLSVAGWKWSRSMQRQVFRLPNRLDQECFDYLDTYLLRVIIAVGAGNDVEGAFQDQLASLPESTLIRQYFRQETTLPTDSPAVLKQIFLLRERARKFGSPVRQELMEIVAELESQRENHWEEASQILPLKLLAPMFLCVFPSNLLAILAPFVPLLRSS